MNFSTNYLDGYNRGFLKGKADGVDYRVSQQKNSPFDENGATTPYQSLSTPLYHPDFNFFQQMLSDAEAQYETEHRQNNNSKLSDHDQQVISQLNNPDHIQMQENYIKFLKLYYSQLKVLLATIPDGVYAAIRITGIRNVEKATVIVKYDKIIEISTKNPFDSNPDIWYYTVDITEYQEYKNYDIVDVMLQPVPISNGKATYPSITWADKAFYDNKYSSEIYFIDYISSLQKNRLIEQIRLFVRDWMSLTAIPG